MKKNKAKSEQYNNRDTDFLITQEFSTNASTLLFQKSREVYVSFTNPGGLFSYFECNDKLFPSAKPINSSYKSVEDSRLVDISEFYYLDGNLVLIGEGGTGKTTSLLKAWKDMLDKYDVLKTIPVFIPLNEANNISENEIINHGFIKNYMKVYYDFDYTEAIGFATTEKSEEATLIFLLDGFNEITDRNRQIQVSKEIKTLIAKSYARIIMTSRFDFINVYDLAQFKRFDILPLEEAIIADYLASEKLSTENAPLKLLSNPMMLTLYTNMCKIKEKISDKISLPFFDSNSKGSVIADFLLCQIGKSFSVERASLSYLVYVALFVVCPYIAHAIEIKGLFSFEWSRMNEYIIRSLKLYANQMEHLFNRDLYSLSCYGTWAASDDNNTVAQINKILLQDLSIVQNSGKSLSFRHQYFRDFFSAWYILNDAEFYLDSDTLPNSLTERVIPEYIASIVGDLKIGYSDELNTGYSFFDEMIKRLVNQDFPKKYILLNNVIYILRIAKGDILSFISLDHQDLTMVPLSGIVFSENGSFASFDYSKIASRTFVPQGHIGQVRSAVYNSEAKVILSAGDTTIKEWDCVTGMCIATYFGHTNLVNTACFSPKEDKVLSAGNDNTVREWDRDGRCLHVFNDHSGYVTKAIYDSTGDRVYSCSWDGLVLAYSRVSDGWSAPTIIAKHSKNIKSIALTADETKIITASGDGSIKEWSIPDPLVVQSTFSGHTDMVNTVIYAHNDEIIISGGYDNAIGVFSRKKGFFPVNKYDLGSWVRNIVYDRHNDAVIVSSQDGNIYEYALHQDLSLQLVLKYIGHTKPVTSVSFSNDGLRLVSTSEDGTIREWDRESGQCIRIYQGNDFTITNTIYSGDGRSVITIKDNVFTVSKRTDGIPFYISREAKQPLCNAVFENDDNVVLYTTNQGLFRIRIDNEGRQQPECLINAGIDGGIMLYAKHDRKNGITMAISRKLDDTTIVYCKKDDGGFRKTEIPVLANYVDTISEDEFITFSSGGVIRVWEFSSGKQCGVLGVNVRGCSFANCTYEDNTIEGIIREAGGIVR